MKKQKSAAILTIHDAHAMTKRGRTAIVKWLRRQANFLDKEAANLSHRFTARYLYSVVAALAVLTGCSTYADLGQGHIARTLVSEERSPFGTNMGFGKLQHCEKQYDPGQTVFYKPVNCTDLTGWVPMWSQGQGGQVAAGALNAVGLGVLGATMPSNGATSSASQSQSLSVTAPGKGGHH